MTLKLCMKYFLCEYYQGCSNYDPFYAKVKFGHIGFCMGKSENYYFFFFGGGGGGGRGNNCSLMSQSCLKNLTK